VFPVDKHVETNVQMDISNVTGICGFAIFRLTLNRTQVQKANNPSIYALRSQVYIVLTWIFVIFVRCLKKTRTCFDHLLQFVVC